MIGLKVYADKLTPYIHWNVDYFEVYIRHIDHMGCPIDLETQLKMLEPIKDKVKGIHGGILYQGVNFCDANAIDDNKKALDIVFESLDFFPNCKYIVFHPGCFTNPKSCSLSELISWVKPIQDKRFMLEIEPFLCYKERYCFPLYKPEDYLMLKYEIGKEILVDTGHALIMSRVLNLEPYQYINELIDVLNPSVIHLANNDRRGDGYEDSHLPLGQGELDFTKLANKFAGKYCTIEVGNLTKDDLHLVQSLRIPNRVSTTI